MPLKIVEKMSNSTVYLKSFGNSPIERDLLNIENIIAKEEYLQTTPSFWRSYWNKKSKTYKKWTILEKFTFSERFNFSKLRQIQDVVGPCPLSGMYPRFPVRDIRTRVNGEKFDQVYDWAGLQFVLQQPSDKRVYVHLSNANHEDFEFCEDLCLKLHRLLWNLGSVQSDDPITALLGELWDLGDFKHSWNL